MHQNARRAQRADHVGGHVARRSGRTRSDDDRVALGQRLLGHRLQRGKIIGDNSIADRFPSLTRDQRRERVRVNVTHPPQPGGGLWFDDLVSAGNESHARLADDVHADDAQRHQPADLRLAQRGSARQDDLPRAHVFADLNHVLAHRDGAGDLNFTCRGGSALI